MNNGKNYYDIAERDYQYFMQYRNMIHPEYNNPLAIQAQQIVEKLLKHIIECYCQEEDPREILRSHKLQSIYLTINRIYPVFQLNRNDLLFLSSFYYDARYPGVDFIMVNREDAIRCIQIVEEVKLAVDEFIMNMKK